MVENTPKKWQFLDANQLRFLALFFMLLDHMWATIIPGNIWMTYVGRLAFPIFAFQIVEGYFHTSNVKRYAKRLFYFALISEIPFNLMLGSSWLYPFHQNVIFTLLLGLFAIKGLDYARKKRDVKSILIGLLTLAGTSFLAQYGFTDYGAMGVYTIVAFYIFRGFKGAWIGQLLALIYLNIIHFQGQFIPIEFFGSIFEFTTQGFAVFALLPIWLYNGKKGSTSKTIQYISYWFYPVHMLILYILFQMGL